MFDKDSKLLFEAYQDVVNEAPIDPGGAWDMPSADITGKLSDLKSKRTGETVDSMLARFSAETPETRVKLIDFTRQLLQQYEGSHFGGTPKQFALELADKIKDKAGEWGFKTFRSPHISRVLVNALLDLDVITKDGEVQNVDKLEDEKEVLELPAKGDKEEDTPVVDNKFNMNDVYGVDPLAANDLSPEERDLSDYVPEEGATGKELIFLINNTIAWRDANPDDSDRGRKLKLQNLLSNWVKDGILVKKADDSKEDFGGKHIDVGDETDDRHAAGDYLSSQGIDVPTKDLWSGGMDEWN